MKLAPAVALFVGAAFGVVQAADQPGPQADAVIPEAGSYVSIPNPAVPLDKKRTYRAIYDATRAAGDHSQLVPALNVIGIGLNGFAASGVPLSNARFALIFHGPAIFGILDDVHYRAKFGVANPNLRVLAELKKAGVEIFVCGQNLAHENIDPRAISPHVAVASAAQFVLITYQNDGYALLSL